MLQQSACAYEEYLACAAKQWDSWILIIKKSGEVARKCICLKSFVFCTPYRELLCS